MESSKLLFILVSVFIFFLVPIVIKNRQRYYLGLSGFVFIFSTGWIFLINNNGLMLADLSIFGLFLLAIFSKKKFRWSVFPIGWPFLGICLWGVISSFFATRQDVALIELSRYFRAYLLMLCLYHHIQSIDDLKVVLNYFLLGLLFESLLAIYQWKFGALGLWFLGERRFVGWRSTGTFFVPAFLANYLVMALPVAYKVFLFYKAPRTSTTVLYGIIFIAGLIGLLTTYARSEWIGFLTALSALLLFSMFYRRTKIRAKSMWIFPFLVLFLLVFASRYTPTILSQFGSTRKSSYEIRFNQFQFAQRIISKNPLFGTGLANYSYVARDYLTPEERLNPAQYIIFVHNSYLYVTAEMGVPAGIFLMLWLGSLIYVGIRIIKARVYHPLILNFALGISGGLIAIMIVFTFTPDIHSYDLLYHLGLYSGIMMGQYKLLKIAESKKRVQSLKERYHSNTKTDDIK